MPILQKILLPVDFSAGAQAAVDYAGSLGAKFHATVDILFVWNPPVLVPESLLVVTQAPGSEAITIEQLARNRAMLELKAVQMTLHKAGVEGARIHLGVGDAAHEIVAMAEHGAFDLIVMGTHGRSGLARFALGSVAEKVVRHATCPVLTVRRSETQSPEKGE
jgi:nucleotide-binding universal stress UspA family protein